MSPNVALRPSAPITPPPDLVAIKAGQQKTWASGDFAIIGTTLQIVGESLAEAIDLRAGERVLDVAAGNGNATLAAARRFAEVTATDYVPELLDKAAQRARAEGLQVIFLPADAESLPFDDGSFDVTLSTFGAMFAPDHTRTARELLRVTRSGGRIGLANWTPDGFVGELFKVVGSYLPPPAGLRSPALWGTEPHLVELFGPNASDIRCERRNFAFRYLSAAHWLDVFRRYYGPTHRAFANVAEDRRDALAADLIEMLERRNIGGKDSLVIPGEYLEVVISRK